MSTKIFVNLPVKDLNKSIEFFTKLGYTFNAQFTDKTATCMIISESIYAMLLTHKKFMDFTSKTIIDAHNNIEVMNAFSVDTREEVDAMMEKALAAGATENNQAQDHGFMYSRSFSDLDGHVWEMFWMDLNAIPQQ